MNIGMNDQVCRVCGCTWDNACPGGCFWVEDDLCSQCAVRVKGYTIHEPVKFYIASRLGNAKQVKVVATALRITA